MTEMPDKARTESLITALRKVPAFADLSAEDLEWFIGHAEERRAKPGEAVTVEDSPAELMLVLLEGEIRGRREADGPDSQTYTVQAPAVRCTPSRCTPRTFPKCCIACRYWRNGWWAF